MVPSPGICPGCSRPKLIAAAAESVAGGALADALLPEGTQLLSCAACSELCAQAVAHRWVGTRAGGQPVEGGYAGGRLG